MGRQYFDADHAYKIPWRQNIIHLSKHFRHCHYDQSAIMNCSLLDLSQFGIITCVGGILIKIDAACLMSYSIYLPFIYSSSNNCNKNKSKCR